MSLVLQILTLLGSLGMFLYGMSLMSGGLQKMAGNRLRSFMAKMTSSTFKCILTGITVTALVQSSTATTLMLVSFVNAGLLSLATAIAVIMGANIGTTVTAWIFALSFGAGSFSFGTIAVPLMALAYLLVSSKNKKNNNMGEFIMGFALLFLGLATLRETSTVLLDNEPVRQFLGGLTGWGFGSMLLFMVAGACMTLMLQSSAATMAITMVLVANGYIPFTMAAAMVLGENIGTTITSNIAASVANVSAKRTARAHLLFNLFGVLWVICLFHPFLNLLGGIVELFGFPNPATTDFAAADAATREALVASLPYSVATLHTLFNLINTCILVWFIPIIEKIVTWMVPAHKEEDEKFRLKYINSGLITTGDLALNSVKLELVRYGDITSRIVGFLREGIKAESQQAFQPFDDELIRYEEITDRFEKEIAAYLNEATKREMSHEATLRVKEYYRIIGELESIGDSGETMGKIIARAWAHEKQFLPDMKQKLLKMCDLLDEAFAAMHVNLETPSVEITDISNAEQAEENINSYRDILREEHLSNIEKSNYPYETGAFYMDLVNSFEKMGDFLINISQSVYSVKDLK